jgi:hypothetical protein
MDNEKLRIKLQGILGCSGDWCWPCSHYGKIDTIIAEFNTARLGEVLELRAQYHHLEEGERQLKFVLFMDKRVSELEKIQKMDKTP